MIASRNDESAEVAFFARHAMQRFYRAHHGQIRHELIICIDEQLCPRPVDRKRFNSLSVCRQSSVLDDAATLEQRYCLSVRKLVERNRKLERRCIDTEISASHRYPL